jgi:hypothetical protein
MGDGNADKRIGMVVSVLAVLGAIASGRGCPTKDPGEKVSFGELDVHYKDGASKEEAEKLGAFLEEIGYGSVRPSSVLLSRPNDAYVVSFVVIEDAWNDDQARQGFAEIGPIISGAVFDGAAIEVRMLDDRLNHKRTVAVELAPAGTDAEEP